MKIGLILLGIVVLVGGGIWVWRGAGEAESVVVPSVEPEVESIQLFYYSSERDKDATGNVLCSRQGLVAVTRTVPVASATPEGAVWLLLTGGLTAEERAAGLSTEYPLSGVTLQSTTLNNGVLTLVLSDPENKTSGGACRAGVLWYQIEATAKQFAGVSEVRFMPEFLFQP